MVSFFRFQCPSLIVSASVLTERKILVDPKASFEAYLMIRILNLVIQKSFEVNRRSKFKSGLTSNSDLGLRRANSLEGQE